MVCGVYYFSGGFVADSTVRGYVNFGSQKQYMSCSMNFRGG